MTVTEHRNQDLCIADVPPVGPDDVRLVAHHDATDVARAWFTTPDSLLGVARGTERRPGARI